MTTANVAQVALDGTSFHFDKLYSYLLTEKTSSVQVGCRVLVPFGRGNRPQQGLVMALETVEDTVKLKPITAILDEKPLLNDEMLQLAQWLHERTFCTLFEAVRAMLPTGLYLRIRPVYAAGTPDDGVLEQLSDAEYALYTALKTAKDGVREDLLSKRFPFAEEELLDSLVARGVLVRHDDAFRSVGDASVRQFRLSVEESQWDELKPTQKQRAVLELLRDAGCACLKEITYFTGVTAAVVTALQKKGFIESFDTEVSRAAVTGNRPPISPIRLNDEQKKAYDLLLGGYEKHEPAGALLYGVTGSGKTQVYLHLIDRVLTDGRQVLVLVPEISLTPQMQKIFTDRYGDRVAIMHSALSMGRRMDEWKRIRSGDAQIVVGTRLAVFSPFKDLGLIVMDEEQEHCYKSESAPRYHARDVAKFRSAYHRALLVMASATPSLETFHLAKIGRYLYTEMPSRYGNSLLPTVQTVDLRQEEMGEEQMLSPTLRRAVNECLDEGRQVILLHNRRGFHTNVSCRQCGTVMTCPHCSVSMTYHRANGRLMCHYCGYTRPMVHLCPSCGSDKIRAIGVGTQKVEEELRECFPDRRILRMDTDTTVSRDAYEKHFRAFGEGQYDILLGTQMVAKGLDFPKVGLVGVLSADQTLFSEDFRSFETAFDLLTQVVGRAGRRDTPGKALIQTYCPDHYVISLAAKQDYLTFYDTEIRMRRGMKYPPFSDLVRFVFSGTDEGRVAAGAKRFVRLLKETAQQYTDLPVIALDPIPAMVARVSGKYRYQLLIKTVNNRRARDLVRQVMVDFGALPEGRRVTVVADINPAGML